MAIQRVAFHFAGNDDPFVLERDGFDEINKLDDFFVGIKPASVEISFLLEGLEDIQNSSKFINSLKSKLQ